MLIERLLAAAGGVPGPFEDYWYQPAVPASDAGVRVTADTSLTASAVWDGITMIARDVGSVPCLLYKWLPDGGKQRAPGHPLFDLIRYQPNAWQSALDYWQTVMGHILLRGNHYTLLVPGPRGFVDQLIPLHPDCVTPRFVLSPLTLEGRTFWLPEFWYEYRRPGAAQSQVYREQQIWHVRGYSTDGLLGLSVIDYARQSIGLMLAMESFGARFFSQGSKPAGILKHPAKLSAEAAERLKARWQEANSGLGGAHKVAVLEEGLEWQQVGMTDKDAQFLELRQFSVEDAARWTNVPVSRLKRQGTQTYASAYMYELEYWQGTIRPWCVTLEQAIRRDLIQADKTYFAEFMLDAVLRGDPATRAGVYHNAILDGWMTRNEVRAKENLNPLPGLDEPLEPRNMAPAGMQTPQPGRAVVEETAARLVRKEIAAVEKAVERFGATGVDYRAALSGFYASHRALVAASLKIGAAAAAAYCDSQLESLEAEGPGVTRDWLARMPRALTLLALESGNGADHV